MLKDTQIKLEDVTPRESTQSEGTNSMFTSHRGPGQSSSTHHIPPTEPRRKRRPTNNNNNLSDIQMDLGNMNAKNNDSNNSSKITSNIIYFILIT